MLQCEYAGHCRALSEKEETRREANYHAQIAAVSALRIGVMMTRGIFSLPCLPKEWLLTLSNGNFWDP